MQPNADFLSLSERGNLAVQVCTCDMSGHVTRRNNLPETTIVADTADGKKHRQQQKKKKKKKKRREKKKKKEEG